MDQLRLIVHMGGNPEDHRAKQAAACSPALPKSIRKAKVNPG